MITHPRRQAIRALADRVLRTCGTRENSMNIPSTVLDKLCSVEPTSNVETLAQWLHEAMRDYPGMGFLCSWADVGESSKRRYRHVARKMLAVKMILEARP